ncbi:MBL fold metallo-hydrolase [Rhodococcoides kroppenstedtii]|uniref:MBL fold metallo-hydrolase n=1 Tax=Rhodococcoides kroppenstedtii TaxID=293050 RepID=UPI001BDE236F|nr:MBL fold metallo-hydrolase [Rhodococcus kroppenstedtii]MBT1191273.1 MBL fold metallo-hydrolase [Rhodococcus kroppenstedtii]
MGTYLGEVPAAGEPMRVASCVEWLLAPNPSAWTFEGTNTWIVGVPGGSTCAVIDPGPDDARHVEALRRAVGRRSVSTVLITHDHDDHHGATDAVLRWSGATLLDATTAVSTTAPRGSAQRSVTVADGIDATVLSTPGHTRDSVCILLPAHREIFTGDAILGSGSPMVRPSLMADMLRTLRTLADLGARSHVTVRPGHGPVLDSLADAANRRLAARLRRIAQVAALTDEDSGLTVDELVTAMYPNLTDPDVRRAAASSVEAIQRYLAASEPVGSEARA